LTCAADTWDFESDNKFKFKVLEHELDTACEEWNAESTLKLKEAVVSVRQKFKWQSTGADATLKEKPFAEWLAPRSLALRNQLHYKGSSRGGTIELLYTTINWTTNWKCPLLTGPERGLKYDSCK